MRVFIAPRCLGLLTALIVFGRPAAADVAVEIGRTVLVVSDVEGQFGDAPAKRIAINDDVVFNEDITTGAEAKTAIEFRDGSTFEVGPGSVVRIDSFVFNPEEGVSRKALQVGSGVFRYVSAFTTADQSAQISTPGGTLAIRGSVISGIVDPETPTFVYVGEGNASFTNDAGSTDLQPGNAIAVPTRTTPRCDPMRCRRQSPPKPCRRSSGACRRRRACARDSTPTRLGCDMPGPPICCRSPSRPDAGARWRRGDPYPQPPEPRRLRMSSGF